MLPSDPQQKTFSEYRASSKGSFSNLHETYGSQYAEIKEDFFDNDLDSGQNYPDSCNQFGSSTSKAQATVKFIPLYSKLEAIVPRIYAPLKQADAEVLTLTSSLNTNRDKSSMSTQSYLEREGVYENTK